MKVLLINGSPHAGGCTFTALSEIAEALHGDGVNTDFFHIGAKPVSGCMACGSCAKTGKCVLDDKVNELADKALDYDGFIFGSPVYYAGISGGLKSFMDRLFYSAGEKFRLKPAAAVASARRAGTTATLDAINKYFALAQMPVVSSQYWNMVHGRTPEEVKQDLEGLQIMRTLGHNMAWLLKSIEAGKQAGLVPPTPEETHIFTSFIR